MVGCGSVRLKSELVVEDRAAVVLFFLSSLNGALVLLVMLLRAALGASPVVAPLVVVVVVLDLPVIFCSAPLSPPACGCLFPLVIVADEERVLFSASTSRSTKTVARGIRLVISC